MTRNEKIQRIKDHAYGMAVHAVTYARASENLDALKDWQIDIMLEVGETAFKAHDGVSKKYASLLNGKNN